MYKHPKLLLVSLRWSHKNRALKLVSKGLAINLPLGLLYIAAVAEKKNLSVKVLDCDTDDMSNDDILSFIKGYRPDLIGFTVTTPFFSEVAKLATEIKKICDAEIMIGGPHPTLVGKDSMHDCFDYVFMGEGEYSFDLFLAHYKSTENFETLIPGLIYRKDGRIAQNPVTSNQQINMSELPIPSRHLIDTSKYRINVPGSKAKVFTSIMTSRGCPYQCVFCSVSSIYGKKLRYRSVSSIINEIKDCIDRWKIKHFVIIDDTMTVNKSNMEELCREIIAQDLNITWEGWTRVDCIDEELLTIMKRAGFVRVSFGVETGNSNIMKLIRKNVTHEQIRRAFALAKKLDIEARCSLMIGHPGETTKTIWDTLNFVRSNKNIMYSTLSIATPYPGTELATMAKEGQYGLRLLSTDTSKYLRYFSPVMEVNELTSFKLKLMQLFGLLYIHFTPRRICHGIRRFGLINTSISGMLTLLSLIKIIRVKTVGLITRTP